MAHNARVRLDAGWVVGPVVTGAEMNSLDVALAKALNGRGGGSWTPSSTINIGGAGLWLGGPMTLGAGAGISTQPGISASHIVHGTNDYIYLAGGHTGATRIIDTPLQAFATQGNLGADLTYFSPVGKIGNTGFSPVPTQPTGTRFIAPLNVHNGATLTAATLQFRVGNDHSTTGVPDSLPAFRIIAVDVSGNILLLSSTSVAAPDGSTPFTPRPASAAAWYLANAAQSITCTCDQNNVCDTSKYAYFAEVFDEMGNNAYQAALAGNTFHSLLCTFTTIGDLRPQ